MRCIFELKLRFNHKKVTLGKSFGSEGEDFRFILAFEIFVLLVVITVKTV